MFKIDIVIQQITPITIIVIIIIIIIIPLYYIINDFLVVFWGKEKIIILFKCSGWEEAAE